jgi:glycosyltransferase involved in cell wall biosynthesis
MHILSKEFDNLHLVLIGDGPDREHLQKLLHTYQISYTTTGYLSSAWKALPALDLFVLPSINEGMGLVLLEAAQAQVPIVASRTGGIPELFSDGSEVLLCQPADPMDLTISCSNILRNHKLSLELTEKARQRAKVFTVEKMASDTAAFYHEVLDALYQH